MKNKIVNTFAEAVADITDGASIMMDCMLGPGGIAQNLIMALKEKGSKDLTVYPCANFGFVGGVRIRPGLKDYVSPAILVENHQVKRGIITWGRGDADFLNVVETMQKTGEVDIEFIPLGVYAHRLLAGGSGMGGFFSPIGANTVYEKGKEVRMIDGKKFLFEPPLRARFGFVRGYKADTMGNLVYQGTARLFNPLIAKACDVTIAEVDEIVEAGKLDPEAIITPGIFIDRIVKIPEGGWR